MVTRRNKKGEKGFFVRLFFSRTIKGETHYSGLSAFKLKPKNN